MTAIIVQLPAFQKIYPKYNNNTSNNGGGCGGGGGGRICVLYMHGGEKVYEYNFVRHLFTVYLQNILRLGTFYEWEYMLLKGVSFCFHRTQRTRFFKNFASFYNFLQKFSLCCGERCRRGDVESFLFHCFLFFRRRTPPPSLHVY
mmetsp:Transcript_15805/g.23468  ORF Transcript_15805/g.23468 Transcript_15805/m.23468 type:complete len:145 (-) Transcript_15805:111-545(-)